MARIHFEGSAILLFLVASASTLKITDHFQLLNMFDESDESNLISENSTVTVYPIHTHPKVLDWKYRKFCISEVAKNVCMEVGMPADGSHYPKKIRIRRASKKAESVDYSDFPEVIDKSFSCKVPNGLKTAEILCKLWPSSITCNLYCVYASTYNEGIVRTTSCSYKDNKWSQEFEECKPFVDCNLKLISPGGIKCVGNEVLNNPACQVNCDVYEDKDAVKSQIYTCKSDGTWKPPLPFCVELRGTPVVKVPELKEHKKLKYP